MVCSGMPEDERGLNERLARRIERYWRARGFVVRVWAEEFGIRSDLGLRLPPRVEGAGDLAEMRVRGRA